MQQNSLYQIVAAKYWYPAVSPEQIKQISIDLLTSWEKENAFLQCYLDYPLQQIIKVAEQSEDGSIGGQETKQVNIKIKLIISNVSR